MAFTLGQTTTAQMVSAPNPHGDPHACLACHGSAEGSAENAPTPNRVSDLCQSCHDDRNALHRAHPVDERPSRTLAATWPSNLPRVDGRMTCLTCHDIGSSCAVEAKTAQPNTPPAWLRSVKGNRRDSLCRSCHGAQAHPRYNVHNQLSDSEPVAQTCFWCHETTDKMKTILAEGQPYPLRATSSSLCTNCHTVAADHPSGGPHVGVAPSAEMRWYMAAVEMQSHMRLDLPTLTRYAQALKREPRLIPFDEQGRLTCASCHNPHAEGLWPPTSEHAAGAEPAHATGQRLRIGRGKQCLGCHEK